ncbi:MAG: DPP IV N-terminal domain-containing protein [Actinomycetota bacterium]
MFVRERSSNTGLYSHPRLWTVAPDRSRLHPVLGPGATGNDSDPAWSPDGSAIAFIHRERHRSAGRLFTVGTNGSHLVQLTPPWLDASGPSWSPDGTRIVFSANGTRSHRRSGWDQIWLVNVDGSHLHALTRSPREHLDPDWSPDGTQIAYERVHQVFTFQRTDRTGNIHVKGLDLGDGRAITDMIAGHEAFGPVWSPGGSEILFETYRNSFSPFGTKLWTANADGSDAVEVRHVFGLTYDLSAVWSPGGREILVSENGASRRGFWTHLLLMRSDGSHVRRLLAKRNEFLFQPDWTTLPPA